MGAIEHKDMSLHGSHFFESHQISFVGPKKKVQGNLIARDVAVDNANLEYPDHLPIDEPPCIMNLRKKQNSAFFRKVLDEINGKQNGG